MQLTVLNCNDTEVADLSPLQGMPLVTLLMRNTKVSDLSLLRGLPLEYLDVGDSPAISDLAPLRGLRLRELNCKYTQVSDLSPLRGMGLRLLGCDRTLVSDFAVLDGMPLQQLSLELGLFDEPSIQLVKSLNVKEVRPNFEVRITAEEYWQQFAARKAAAEKFAAETAPLPAAEQAKAVIAKLRLGTDGQLVGFGPIFQDNVIVAATLSLSKNSTDITPLRALQGLKKLTVNGGPGWLDLSPLNSLPLEELVCSEDQALKNAPVLAAMKTLTTLNGEPAAAYLAQLKAPGEKK